MDDFTPLELQEIASRIQNNNVRKLGYHLGFKHPQVQRFERANDQSPAQCTGTEDMLMNWHEKGGTRAQLCEALRRVEQMKVACEIENGEFTIAPVAVPQKTKAAPTQPTATQPEATVQSSQTHNVGGIQTVSAAVDLEQALPNIASDLTQEQFERLGIALRFRTAQINRFSSTNFMTGRLTTRGTLDMLYEWRSKTAVPDQKPQLRAALLSLGLRTLADEHLPLA